MENAGENKIPTKSPESDADHVIPLRKTPSRKGPILLKRKLQFSKINQCVEEETCNQSRVYQNQSGLGQVSSTEKIGSDDEGRKTEAYVNQLYPADYPEYEDTIESFDRSPLPVTSHSSAIVQEIHLLLPELKTEVTKIEVPQTRVGMSSHMSVTVGGYSPSNSLQKPSLNMPAHNMCVPISDMKMSHTYADESSLRLTMLQQNMTNDLLSTVMTQSSTGMTQSSTGMTQSSTGMTQSSTGMIQSSTVMTQSSTGMTQSSTRMTQSSTGMTQSSTGKLVHHASTTSSMLESPPHQLQLIDSIASSRPPISHPQQEYLSALNMPRNITGHTLLEIGTDQMEKDIYETITDELQSYRNTESFEEVKHETDEYESLIVEQGLKMRKIEDSDMQDDRPTSHIYFILTDDKLQYKNDYVENNEHADRKNLQDSHQNSHDCTLGAKGGFKSDKGGSSDAQVDSTESDLDISSHKTGAGPERKFSSDSVCYASINVKDDSDYLIPVHMRTRHDFKPLKPRPMNSTAFPLPPTPGVENTPFNEADVDIRLMTGQSCGTEGV
ncbi:hypothetical protein CHS0354_014194 [Potamilus streckersoni]|uniref:Uncharacterized protein n=1 Tax=Potamilus streckersoni TaxID=2493646 RepID=A0AAE0T091_9BIVA|nr:hypothetical protein CHS0354_014194 [Potamilus streckersoni]